MNASILKKAIDELSKETPKIDYVLGMLETLVEVDGSLAQIGRALPETANLDVAGRQGKVVGSTPTGTKTDEAAILDATAKASIATIKALAEQGQE